MHAHMALLKKATGSGKFSDFFVEYKYHIKQLEREVLQILKEVKWMEAEKLKTENPDLKRKISDLEDQIVKFQHAKSDGKNDKKEKSLETENTELKRKLSDLENQIVQIPQATSIDSYEEKIKNLEDANAELQKNISDLEKKMVKDKDDFEKEKKEFSKKFSDFSRKSFEEKKTVELKCSKLSQQVSDFEKVIIMERDKFAKEKKTIEQKNVGIFKEISGQRKNAENGFEEEREMFETEIRKLTDKLSKLSTCALKEQKMKSEFQEKIDLLVKKEIVSLQR
ncbi:hypothetical protein L6452_40681 [Arctium lappa]|uniref:Uncharacterized protein n=1 Tax=Arctium lappa TaxID=4217 RepID=A0ACB8XML2_ARCLA|nr:hypothetical protein L6452_40681 [Arctium lappa]